MLFNSKLKVMKKLALFVATIVAVAFAACCNNAETTEEAAPAEITVIEEAPAVEDIQEAVEEAAAEIQEAAEEIQEAVEEN